MGLGGTLVILAAAWLLSTNRRAINRRTVGVAMATVAGSVLVGYALLGVPLDYLAAPGLRAARDSCAPPTATVQSPQPSDA